MNVTSEKRRHFLEKSSTANYLWNGIGSWVQVRCLSIGQDEARSGEQTEGWREPEEMAATPVTWLSRGSGVCCFAKLLQTIAKGGGTKEVMATEGKQLSEL